MKIIKKVFLVFAAIMLLSGCSSSAETKVYADGAKKPRFSRFSNKPLSKFSTEFKTNDDGRTNNIKKATESINETVIGPNEVFSFNDSVGPTNEKNGYMEAIIFVDGEEELGFGGGVCQVSSTLYNAALEANLEITERHPHSKRVYYVPEGKDAATSYGSVDLKFKNTLGYPIKIKSYVRDGSISVEIIKG